MFSSALTIAGAAFCGVIGLFPNLLASSINASSSPLTPKIMLMVVLLLIPMVLVYQVWAFFLFKGKVTRQDLELDEAF